MLLQRSKYVHVVRIALQTRAPRRMRRLIERGELDRFVRDEADKIIDWIGSCLSVNPYLTPQHAEETVICNLTMYQDEE